ncbi:MAG: ABC transporter permease subunit [Eubacteriales bacterium]|nr:ABC transporter permease subunit [Eubacteriales bacterium]
MGHKGIKNALAVLFWLMVWQAGAMLANHSLLLPIPTPITTLQALGRLLAQGSFYFAVGTSLLRIAIGFVLALAAGTVSALLSTRFRLFAALTAPLLQLIRAIPVASFTILLFLWVRRGALPSCVVFLTVYPLVWANVESGIRQMDRSLVEMAKVFGMKASQIFRQITLPSLRPYFGAASASGLGFAWKSGVAAEVICRSEQSIGNLLWVGKNGVDYDEVFALTLVIVLCSVALQVLAGRLMKGGWQHDSV